jgi:hypothetical protein
MKNEENEEKKWNEKHRKQFSIKNEKRLIIYYFDLNMRISWEKMFEKREKINWKTKVETRVALERE